jgi:hypothetical protein
MKARMSTPLLIGGLVGVLGIGAAVGIVLGSGGEPTPSPGALATAAPSIDLRTPGPVVSLAPIPTSGPVATPVVATPAPVTPTPGPGGGGTQDASIDNLSITVPANWEVEPDETSITLFPAEGGYVYLESVTVSGSLTASEVLQLDVDYFKENRADTEVCGAEEDFTLHNGPAGRSMYLCYTTESQSGNSYPAILFVAAATVASGGNTTIFYVSVFAPADIWDAVLTVVQPVLPSINWKLYQGG